MTTKFYTNIERYGNNILYMGYENGLPVKKKVKYRPHLFTEATGKKTEYKSFSTKQNLERKEFNSIKGMRDFIDTYSDVSNFSVYGCSDMIRQFTANEFRGKIEWDYSQAKIWFFDIETRVEGLDIDQDSILDIRVGEREAKISYKTAMMLLDHDKTFDVLLDDSWYPIKQSPIYVAGFPKPELAQQEVLLISLIDHHKAEIHLWANKKVDVDNEMFSIDVENRILKLKSMEGMEGSHKTDTYSVDLHQFDMDEHGMLNDFLSFWQQQRIDVISGWNSEGFDIPYLINRMSRILGEERTADMSPWGIIKKRNFRDGKEQETYDIYGITHLDYLDLYKKFNPGSKESFKLDFIANLELGHGKLPLTGETFRDNYIYSWDKFILYNLIDTHLIHQLETEMLQVRLAMTLAYFAKCNYVDVISAMRLWESIIYNYFLDLGIVEDYSKKKAHKKHIVGAYVHEPKPGKYGWTISIDATAKYPSIMMQNNLSPETIVGKWDDYFIDNMLAGEHIGKVPEGCILSANGLLTKKDIIGFIPVLVKRMFDLRKETKGKMLDKKKELESIRGSNPELCAALETEIAALDVAQSSFKVAANSFFGIQSMEYFKYYDPDMAEAITSTGQVFIKHTMRIINEMMRKIMNSDDYYPILADTDSVYFDADAFVKKFCVGKSDQEIVTYLETFVFNVIQPELNKQLTAIANTMGIDDCRIFYKLECIGPALLPLRKKKYLFDILYSEGVRYQKPKMKVMGIEIVRSSTPSAVRDYMTKVAELCLRGTESQLQDHILNVKKQFMNLDYTLASFPRGCNGLETYTNDQTIYGAKTPIAVRGALVFNHHLKEMGLDSKYPLINDGERVRFIMLNKRNPFRENVISFPSTLPPEFEITQYIDWETQYQKAFLEPVKRLSDAIGWNLEKQPDPEFLFG